MTPELILKRNHERLNELDPEKHILFAKFLQKAKLSGMPLLVTCAYRTFEQQESIYWGCRDEHGQRIPGKAIATNARAGMSWHNFRGAIDVAFIDNGGNPTWEGDWDRLGEIGESCGLTWSGRWKGFQEKCHFQIGAEGEMRELKIKFALEITKAMVKSKKE